jgi:hypothetical protein
MTSRTTLMFLVALGAAAAANACGSSNQTGFPDGGLNGDGTTTDARSGRTDGPHSLGGGTDSGTTPKGPLSIAPTNKTLTVAFGSHTPTVVFQAKIGGTDVPASFTVDLAQIATVDPSSGLLSPSGKIGGVASVTATYKGETVSTHVTVILQVTDDGAPATTAGDAGSAGGNGGVGGSPAGGPVSSAAQTVLQGMPQSDTGLGWLYPYDKTVWPQGLLAPLLQWSAPRNYDAIYVHLQEAGVDYKGFFSAPVAGQPFVNVPISQAAWDTLSYSNQGEPVTVTLVFSSAGVAYGPLNETWTIAPGTLTGTVYYNSYGTALAINYPNSTAGYPAFGGATLAIKRGATSPVLVAGTTGGVADCRVCHSVAAGGSTLITEHGDDYQQSSAYALAAGNAETVMPPLPTGTATVGTFAFPAISPDGTFLFANAGPLPGVAPPATSGLFSVPSGAPITATGLPAGLAAATPSFSPDAKHIAFNAYSADMVSLAAIDFVQSSNTFSNLQTLDTPAAGTDVFPAFLPTNDSVIFERETVAPNPVEFGATRDGARGELWWVDLATHTAAALATLNGASYLPTGANNHMDDATLDYEPTVNPVVSGGYAWVVFTSRRLYGNVATQDPFLSDPRAYNASLSATTKKLWVAAIDLNAKPGTDPSHPAFYLPAQELLACNSRGYWVVDPCEPNGDSCLTGDQCCSGSCEPADGGFVCGVPPKGCAALSNKCTTTADCCDTSSGVTCIDGFCAQPAPPPPP